MMNATKDRVKIGKGTAAPLDLRQCVKRAKFEVLYTKCDFSDRNRNRAEKHPSRLHIEFMYRCTMAERHTFNQR